jgi:PiT family inorganic phosphate transporter
MNSIVGSAPPRAAAAAPSRPRLDHKTGKGTWAVFVLLMLAGLGYTAWNIATDSAGSGEAATAIWPFVLLGLALLIALGFEFVNGFHDTANAVATVIYTNSLPPQVAVVWSGLFNFLGVLVSSGAVAFGIISLLPVELILQVGSGAGFAMVFALLIAAIAWNLGTWALGLPASSSHTLSGVDCSQAIKIGYSLLLSPLVGFLCAALLLLALRTFVKDKALYEAPRGSEPPPLWIRALLILTCTGVSFSHGSNDGQKGMGLIMLILVGTVPISYALNRAMPVDQTTQFATIAHVARASLERTSPGAAPADSRATLSHYVRTKVVEPTTLPALAAIAGSIGDQVQQHDTLAKVPAAAVANVRNDMYLASETIRLVDKDSHITLDAQTHTHLMAFKKQIDAATKFIPLWVKVAVAIALGLGTMIGWKRIVVTVGEKIGKAHLTYAQGMSAELVAMITIGAADNFGLPMSTTHVLSSGVAGTMAANRSGLQWSTIRNLAIAWVLTLPAAVLLSGSLYWLFTKLF